jgi:exopolysaccharide production protein ExoZ
MNRGSSEVLLSIQILRGVAAMMVLFYHLPDFIGVPYLTFLSGGVDIFFVISGVVIMISTMHSRDNVREFVWKRMLRVVPLYWLATLSLALVWMVTGLRELRADELAMSLLFIPYLDEAKRYVQPMLLVGWTLNLELGFYALFAVSMFLRPGVQTIAMTILFLALLAVRGIADPHDQSALFFYTASPLLEFAGGMALALALAKLKMLPRIAGSGLILAGGLIMITLGEDLALPREVTQGLPAVVIVAGFIAIEPWFRARAFAPLFALGDASYALYLTHVITLTVLRPLLAAWPWWTAGLLMLASCTVTALATYRFIERPLLRWARTNRVAQPQAAVS